MALRAAEQQPRASLGVVREGQTSLIHSSYLGADGADVARRPKPCTPLVVFFPAILDSNLDL